MRSKGFGVAGVMAAALVLAVNLTAPPRANASIHEIIAALCRAGGEEVVPHGQNKDGFSFLRALQATGFITSIDTSDPDKVVIHFDQRCRIRMHIGGLRSHNPERRRARASTWC